MRFSLGSIVRTIFLPIRALWSPFIYPLQLVFQKPRVNSHTQSIIIESRHPDRLFLYIPGRDETNLSSSPFARAETNIEVIPPPTPFSLSDWGDTINQRIKTYRTRHPHSKVYVFGVSIGGAATGIACARNQLENVKYSVINSFSSLPQLLWNDPATEITALLAHTAIAALALIAFNSQAFNGLMLTGIILGGCSILGILFSQVFIRIAQNGSLYDWQQFYRCLPNTNSLPATLAQEITRVIKPFNNTYSNILMMIPVALYKLTMIAILILISLIYYASYIPYQVIHLLSHASMYGLLWLMNSHHHIGKLLAPMNRSLLATCTVFQTPGDSVIPPAARLSKHCEYEELNGTHNQIDYNLVMNTVCPTESHA